MRQKEREKTGATINSTLVMRGEKAKERLSGWREGLRGEKQARRMRTYRSHPKIIPLFITQTTEVRKKPPMHVQHSLNILIVINL